MQQDTSPSLSNIAPGEIIIGTLLAFDKQGRPLVDFSANANKLGTNNQQGLVAMTTLALTQAQIGRQVALLFANGDLQNPVIMGVIHSPLQDLLENVEQTRTQHEIKLQAGLNSDDLLVDGKKIVFDAKEEIVFKCGESSITLTKAGKILIRGNYLLNRSSGVNRIMGGSVQVN